VDDIARDQYGDEDEDEDEAMADGSLPQTQDSEAECPASPSSATEIHSHSAPIAQYDAGADCSSNESDVGTSYDSGLFSDSDFDTYDELQEMKSKQQDEMELEDQLKELEEMLDSQEYAELWDGREFFLMSARLNRLKDHISGKEELTAEDLIDIQAFKLKIVSNMSRVAFQQMRDAFRNELEISSLYIIVHKLSILSGILPKWFDCCINTCIAYTSEFEKDSSCPLCGEPRFSANGEPRRVFCYLPLIPRLQKYFLNIKTANELGYRAEYTKSSNKEKPRPTSGDDIPPPLTDDFDDDFDDDEDDEGDDKDDRNNLPEEAEDHQIGDIFDSEHYRNLCGRKVTIDGRKMPYRYFSQDTDIAFATCLDGYLLYKRRRGGPSATPILVQLYNLPPEIRTHINRLICLGVIPGPKSPKLLYTFLYPLDQELVALAIGIKTFDCRTKEYFDLRAYNLFALGDIIAIEKFLNIKGHNGKCPCRSCQITAVAALNKAHTYYVPLGRPLPATNTWDPRELPMRKHEHWEIVTQKIANAPNKKKKNEIAMRCGIKGMPALSRVGSMDYARGIPWDYMHLLLENVIQNLVKLWMGRYKGARLWQRKLHNSRRSLEADCGRNRYFC
jgi:hypothetical protein